MSRRRSPTCRSTIRWRSTTTMRSGARSTTNTGRRIISSTPRAASATTISARATTTESEQVIQQLLAEAGASERCRRRRSRSMPQAREAAADMRDVQSPETYIGYDAGREFRLAGRRRRRTRPCLRSGRSRGSTNGGWPATGRSAREHAALDAQDGAHRLPFPRPRPASGAWPRRRRQAGALPRHDRRRAARRRPRRRRRRAWRRRRDGRAAALPARPPEAAQSATALQSSSSTRACRPTPSPSAETGADFYVTSTLRGASRSRRSGDARRILAMHAAAFAEQAGKLPPPARTSRRELL